MNHLVSRRYGEGVQPTELRVLIFRLAELTGDAVMGRVDLDHVAVAVHGLERAALAFGYLGLEVGAVEEIEHEQARVLMVHVGTGRLELIEPLTQNSHLQRFLEKHGEGLHHVALRVEDVDAIFSYLQSRNVRLASGCVKSGADGHRYFFLHPESMCGVLVELVSEKKA